MIPSEARSSSGFSARCFEWIDRTILSLGREMRVEFLPPLMVLLPPAYPDSPESPRHSSLRNISDCPLNSLPRSASGPGCLGRSRCRSGIWST